MNNSKVEFGRLWAPKAAGTAVAAAGCATAAEKQLSERSQSDSWDPEKVTLGSPAAQIVIHFKDP